MLPTTDLLRWSSHARGAKVRGQPRFASTVGADRHECQRAPVNVLRSVVVALTHVHHEADTTNEKPNSCHESSSPAPFTVVAGLQTVFAAMPQTTAQPEEDWWADDLERAPGPHLQRWTPMIAARDMGLYPVWP